jgi:hypothetical protein
MKQPFKSSCMDEVTISRLLNKQHNILDCLVQDVNIEIFFCRIISCQEISFIQMPSLLYRQQDGPKHVTKTLLRIASYGMLRRVALVRTYVSEELSASFIRVTRIGELGTTLAVTSNRRALRSC